MTLFILSYNFANILSNRLKYLHKKKFYYIIMGIRLEIILILVVYYELFHW